MAISNNVNVNRAQQTSQVAPTTLSPAQTAGLGAQVGAAFAGEKGLLSGPLAGCGPEALDLAYGMATGALRDTTAPKTISAGQLDFARAAPVVSNAQKFILPVPRFSDGGEPLVYPAGAKDKDGADISGQAIKDWQGKPIGDKGVVFFNHKDKSWQAVKSDGEGVVIMNQVTEQQAKKLMAKVGGDPGKLTLAQFKEVLSYAAGSAGLGDMYNSDRSFIKNKMNAMEKSNTGVAQFGLHRRDDKDVCHALFIPGRGEFQGPAATPQKFENGAVILKQGADVRLIQPDAFAQTYTQKNGSPVDVGALPRHIPA
jgi:hypothetical protein